MEKIVGQVIQEKQRWQGAENDTVLVVVRTPERDVVVKAKEQYWPIHNGAKRVFWGQMTGYRSKWRTEPQLAAFCYTDWPTEGLVGELLELLLGRGFPRDLAAALAYEWGPRAKQLAERNPYLLSQFDRVGFKLCDRLYLDLGKPRSALKRQTLCGVHWLANAGGSIWHPAAAVHQAIRESVGAMEVNPERAVRLGVRAGVMAAIYTDAAGRPAWDGDHQWLAEARMAKTEQRLAQMIREFQSKPNKWPAIAPWEGGEHQHEQLTRALASPVGLLLGSAGTGKTYTAAQVIRAIAESGATYQIAAPTGKAAVRLSEALANLHLEARAKTLHSLMGFDGSKFSKEIDTQFLFVDESSMIDLPLMAAVFEKAKLGTHILFLGDPYQLPPVGPGAPLRDMEEFVPTGTLTEVRRNAGAIVAAGVQIRQGMRFQAHAEWSGEPETNLLHLPAANDEESLLRLRGLIETLDANPWSLQVVCAVNTKSRLSCSEVNKLLQQVWNPGELAAGTPFRPGDKVMALKNSWLLPAGKVSDEAVRNKAGEVYVANGEFGVVQEIEPKSLTVEMLAPNRVVRVSRYALHDESEEKETGAAIQLAYAITVHKSQGSQAPYIAYLLDPYPGAKRLADRSLIYTAITRAEQATWLIGDLELAQAAIKRASVFDRKTMLREVYRGEV